MENINNDILKTFDTANVWLDVDTLAKLKNVSNRAIRLALTKENSNNQKRYTYRTEKVRGGSGYKILLSSIEEELQIKYIKEYYAELKLTNDIIKLETIPIKKEKIISDKQKNLALSKYDLVRFWENYRLEQKQIGISNRKSDIQFLENYNTGILYPEIYKTLEHVGIGALYRWKSLIDNGKDWTSLVGNYRYSSNGIYRTKLKEEEIQIFLKILLSPNRFSIGKAISLTKHILKEKDINDSPSDITFKRYADWYKANNYDKWVLAREGYKALKDKVEPYIVRNIDMLEVGQVLIADGHTLNFQVINPFTGKPCRATLIGFLDWKSGGLVGYDIMLEESTQSIASALRNAILTMNHIPEFVYQDNGRAFKSKFFNGDTKFEELGFTGIYEKLGIKPVYATPYNARAKVIERFFLDFQESFEKLIPSYIGTSIENKPAYMKRNEKLHAQIHKEKASFIPTIEQALALVKEWLKFKHAQSCPNNRTKTIQEMLNQIPKQNIDENTLDDLMMAQEIKHIGRNGIRFLKADYFNDELYGIRGKAIIKYNLNDLSYIKVYSTKGEFLCRADRVTGTHPLAEQLGDIKDIEDYKQKIKKQGHLRKKTINAVKEHFKLEDIDTILTICKSELIAEEERKTVRPFFTKSEILEKEGNTELIKNEIKEEQELLEIQEPIKEKPNKEKLQETFVQNRKRPIFKENYERYEWHMKNGCIGIDDRKWLSEYIKSEEYKTIYEK